MCRDLFKSFFLVILALAIALTANIFILRTRAFDAPTYKNYLATSGFYETFSQEIKNYIDKESKKAEEPTAEQNQIDSSQVIMQAFIAKGLTPAKLQQITEILLDRAFSYIKGETKELKTEDIFVLLITEPKNESNFYDQIESKVNEYLVDLDVCDGNATGNCLASDQFNELKNLDIEKLINENPEFKQYLDQINNNSSNSDSPLPTGEAPSENPFNSDSNTTEQPNGLLMLREFYRMSESIVLIGLAVSVLFTLIILLLSDKDLSGLSKTFGSILIIGSIATALIAGLVIFGLWTASQTLILGASVVSPELINAVQKLILNLTFELQKPLYIGTGITLVLGIILTIVGHSTEQKTTEEKVESKTPDIKMGNVSNKPELGGIKAKLESTSNTKQ